MRIGITGSYSSGKNTVCKMFQDLGAVNIDADIIAREIVKPGKTAYNKIIEVFGNEYLNTDGTLNRRKLAELVFSDKRQLEILNAITHPEILNTIMALSEDYAKIFVINTPLLFESGYNIYMDYTITVKANNRLSIERGIIRDNLTKKEIKQRLRNQFSVNKKIKLADYIIDNSKSLEKTNLQVIKIWKILNSMKNQK